MAGLLYIDAAGGLSGDMLAGALLDMGWPLDDLRGHIQAMGLQHVAVSHAREMHMAMTAGRLQVDAGDHHPHRHLADIKAMLARLPRELAQMAGRVFDRLARAEAEVHGVSIEDIHFHEVGAADAMVDVTAFCAGLLWLGSPRVICSPLPLGRGFVDCLHGRLPLPAPAVLRLVQGFPVTSWPGDEETVTPTGAALVTTLADNFGPLPDMIFNSIGIGGGSRPSTAGPNICRLLAGEPAPQAATADQVIEIVCHIDDQSAEDLPIIIERLMAAGALDAAASPLLMKKGRPGLALTVMADPAEAERLADLVLEQTTTLGVRLRTWGRRMLPRQIITVPSPWGEVRVKRAEINGHVRLHPEADDIARICRDTGLPPAVVRARILAGIEE